MTEVGWKQYELYMVQLFFCETTGVKKRITFSGEYLVEQKVDFWSTLKF